jgi:hypothetical protein
MSEVWVSLGGPQGARANSSEASSWLIHPAVYRSNYETSDTFSSGTHRTGTHRHGIGAPLKTKWTVTRDQASPKMSATFFKFQRIPTQRKGA